MTTNYTLKDHQFAAACGIDLIERSLRLELREAQLQRDLTESHMRLAEAALRYQESRADSWRRTAYYIAAFASGFFAVSIWLRL